MLSGCVCGPGLFGLSLKVNEHDLFPQLISDRKTFDLFQLFEGIGFLFSPGDDPQSSLCIDSVGISVVVAGVSRIQAQNQRMRMLLLPTPPGGFNHRKGLQGRSRLRSGHRLGQNLGPKTSRLVIVKQHIVFVELAGDPECVTLALDDRVVTYARSGQRSPGDSDRLIADAVIYHLMPVQDLDRVGLCHPVVLNTENTIPGHQKLVSLLGRNKLRVG